MGGLTAGGHDSEVNQSARTQLAHVLDDEIPSVVDAIAIAERIAHRIGDRAGTQRADQFTVA